MRPPIRRVNEMSSAGRKPKPWTDEENDLLKKLFESNQHPLQDLGMLYNKEAKRKKYEERTYNAICAKIRLWKKSKHGSGDKQSVVPEATFARKPWSAKED